MKVECESVLKSLGLFEEFLDKVGSRIESHKYYSYNKETRNYDFLFENNLSDLKCEDNLVFDENTIH